MRRRCHDASSRGDLDPVTVLLASVTSLAIGGRARGGRPTGSRRALGDRPAPGHWAFDDAEGEGINASTGDATLHVAASVPRVRGVHGLAVALAGPHQLQTRPIATGTTLPEIAFSAWVKPTELAGYKEIFRQECPERLLFSFQNSGTILSLGLNINGYMECDATIDPSQVLDGAWHHAAATFDGRVMRVYLDGAEIGNLDRPGPITINAAAPAFIGSSGGASEHLQGALDDLRIYERALTAAEVRQVYQGGH